MYIIVVLNDQYIKVEKYEIKKDKIVKQLMAFTRMLTTYEITLGSFMTLKYLIMSSSFACKKNSLVQLTQRSLVHHLQLLGVQLALLNSHWFTILNNWPTATLFLEYHHLQLAFIDSWRNTRLRLSFFLQFFPKKISKQ